MSNLQMGRGNISHRRRLMMMQRGGGIDGGNALCFRAVEDSTVQLTKIGTPTIVELEYLVSGASDWQDYTIDDVINLSAGQKIWIRNKSEELTKFNLSTSLRYYFVMTGKIEGSGDVTSLIKRDCSETISGNYAFISLFSGCAALITAPDLLVTQVPAYSVYQAMFYNSGITKIKCLATNIVSEEEISIYRFISGVPSDGTFIKHPAAMWGTGASGIPASWTIIDADI